MERIKILSGPGAKETCQPHAGSTAFRTTCSSTDFASDDQGTNTAFGQIVVRGHAGKSHEHKEFRQKVFDPFTEGMHDGRSMSKRRAHLPQFLFEGVLERHPVSRLFRDGQLRVRCRSIFGSFIDLLDLFRPLP